MSEFGEGVPTGAAETSADDGPATRIDAAWRAARAVEAGSESGRADRAVDAAAGAFVDALLSELLVCPVWDSNGEPPTAEERAAPKLISVDGGEALPLFDSEDRLAQYLDAPSAFIALPGRSFFELAAQHELAIAFNPDVAPSAMTFSAATVAAIAELVEASEEETEITRDDAMEARAPGDAPPALMTALSARLAAAEALASEGWLFEARFAGEAPALVLGLVAAPTAPAEDLRRLAAELSRLGSALLAGGDGLSVAVFAESDVALQRIRAVGFGMRRSAAAAAAG